MKEEEPQEKRKEPLIFTIWVHTGYTILILFSDWLDGLYGVFYGLN